MKNHLVRCIGLVLALALVPVGIEAQKDGTPGDPPNASKCAGAGIRCWFGSAAPCAVVCVVGTPTCEGARCILGFPVASHCYCDVSGIG